MWREFAEHAGVIVVEPGALIGRQNVGVDEVALDGEQGERIESESGGVIVRGLDDVEVFDADAQVVGDVDAGLDGQDHVGREGGERAGAG